MDSESLQLQKELVMLLAILVKRGTIQSTVIHEMSSVGFSPKRISELLNTTSNTVNVALSRKRKTNDKSKE